MSTTSEPSMHEASTPEPTSALHRLRRHVNRRGPAQRRLELGLVVVISGLALTVANRLWRPKPPEIVTPVAQVAPEPKAPPSCDDPATMTKFSWWLDSFEGRSAAPGSLGSEDLQVYAACARKQAEPLDMPSLYMAARGGQVRTVRWLLGAAPVHRGALNRAVLAADAHPEVVALLQSRGAEPPALMEAAQGQAPNALRAALARQSHEPAEISAALASLLERGSRCSACDQHAYAREQVRAVGLLFSKGAKLDGEGLAALCDLGEEMTDAHLTTALAHRRPGAVERALGLMAPGVPEPVVRRVAAEGVDWGYRDGEDDAAMPLVRAIQNRNEGLVRLLVELGAPVERVYKDGSSALESAATCSEGEGACGRITEFLLANGADANRRFPNGSTPLFAAAEAGDGRVIRALLDEGARLETRVLRETALGAAERTGNTLAARILAARGARVPEHPTWPAH